MNGHIVLRVELQSSMEAAYIYLKSSTGTRTTKQQQQQQQKKTRRTNCKKYVTEQYFPERTAFSFNTDVLALCFYLEDRCLKIQKFI